MARISEYNVLFQDVEIFKKRVLNISDSKSKRPPFFLPKMNFKKTSTAKEKCQQIDMELDVQGFNGKSFSEDNVFRKKVKRTGKRTRKHRNTTNSLSSPGNKNDDHKLHGFSLPPIAFKSLELNGAVDNTSAVLDNKEMPYRHFELALNTLMNVIESSKEQQKKTKERFQRSIVHGEQKPINEKLQPAVRAKTSSALSDTKHNYPG